MNDKSISQNRILLDISKYTSSEWSTSIGPIQPYVLADIYSWLESHSGFTHIAPPLFLIQRRSSGPTTR